MLLMNLFKRLALVVFLMLFLVGCVSQSTYNEATEEINTLYNQIQDLKNEQEVEAIELNKQVQKLQDEIAGVIEQLSQKDSEIAELNDCILLKDIDLRNAIDELDEIKNGAQKRLSAIKNHFDKEEWNKVITLSKELHERFNGETEDIEAQRLSEISQQKLDAISAAKIAEEERLKKEAEKSAQDKAREIIRVSKLSPSSPNSAGGVDAYIHWKNNSEKEIKYANFCVQAINGVGDSAKCEIRGASIYWLQSVGPFKKGQGNSGEIYWECIWYNGTIKGLKLLEVEIEYMDGTSVNIDEKSVEYILY